MQNHKIFNLNFLYFTPKKLCVEMSLFSVFAYIYIFFVYTFFRGRKGIIMNSFVTKKCREVFILQLLLDNFLNCTIVTVKDEIVMNLSE